MTIHPRYRFCNIPKYPLYHCLTWSANEFYVYNVYRDMGEELLTEAKLTQGQPNLWSPHQHEWQLTKPRNLRYGLQTACNSKVVSLLSRLFSCSEILLDSVTDIFLLFISSIKFGCYLLLPGCLSDRIMILQFLIFHILLGNEDPSKFGLSVSGSPPCKHLVLKIPCCLNLFHMLCLNMFLLEETAVQHRVIREEW